MAKKIRKPVDVDREKVVKLVKFLSKSAGGGFSLEEVIQAASLLIAESIMQAQPKNTSLYNYMADVKEAELILEKACEAWFNLETKDC